MGYFEQQSGLCINERTAAVDLTPQIILIWEKTHRDLNCSAEQFPFSEPFKKSAFDGWTEEFKSFGQLSFDGYLFGCFVLMSFLKLDFRKACAHASSMEAE